MEAALREVAGSPLKSVPILEARSLSFWYDRQEPPAVYEVELKHEGGIFVIVGTSGSGKSTLLRLLCGLISPASVLNDPTARLRGTVFTLGNPVDGPPPWFAYVPQSFNLGLVPFLSVEGNLHLAVSEDGVSDTEAERARALLMGSGIGDVRSRPIRWLSGGQMQRVAVCRALMTDPRLVFLDEPFANLDASLTPRMGDLLVDLRDRARLAVVLVTHDVRNAVRIADCVLGVRRGYAKPEYRQWKSELKDPGAPEDIERWIAG